MNRIEEWIKDMKNNEIRMKNKDNAELNRKEEEKNEQSTAVQYWHIHNLTAPNNNTGGGKHERLFLPFPVFFRP